MKKVLVTSYEGGQVFVEAPRNTSKEAIFQAVRSYVQEKTEKPVMSLSNYTYETESEWQKRKLASEERGEGFLWDDIPVITVKKEENKMLTLRNDFHNGYPGPAGVRYWRRLRQFHRLLVEKMTRSEMIKNLKEEIGSLTLDSRELENIMPLAYDFLQEKFKGFVADPNNKATEEELKDFQEGKYLVAIGFGEKEVTYTVGRDAQQLANEPVWVYDKYADIETETLAALLEAAQ